MDTKQIDIKVEGVGTIHEGEYGKVKIEGVGKIKGDVKFKSMVIEGTCSADENIVGKQLDIEGILKVEGDIKVRELSIEGLLKTNLSKIYADEIRVEGLMKNAGEVNADKVLIDGCIDINDLFGDEIEINYGYRRAHFFFSGRRGFVKKNHANNIECSQLKACNMTCHSISATDIVLRDHCVVDTVNCNGTLRYDNTCKIAHIEGDCKKINA